ncbi:MAG: hypothetical protein GY906_35655 [bacterium]|nr:hypothetical protein [bacterium]
MKRKLRTPQGRTNAMGNRAHVIFASSNSISPAVYLHWNGGADSVYAFLAELDRRYGPAHDVDYSAARFAAVVSDFFDVEYWSGLSLGITNGPTEITPEALEPFDHGDNGVYVIEPTDGRYTVRRFTRPTYDGVLAEWPRDAVDAERESHFDKDPYSYRAFLAETFAEIDGGRPKDYAEWEDRKRKDSER